ncbi:flagellar biosynthesis protein FlhB [Erythrobacter sp. MTPC3]|uniref:EscU/YscU/HrcU family type III secretion system export apparatus switch protein n=1 Tax=Erythrobacter sp. MTPC3 TaxID=3056564 RepID=UPI0036F32214
MSEQGAGEKTYEPTEKRKRDASKKGDVLRSKELGTAVAIFVGGAWLVFGGPWLLEAIKSVARQSFRFDRGALENFTPEAVFLTAMHTILPPILIFGTVILVATAISQLLIGDGRFETDNLKPKGSRINPGSGLKRMFGTQGLIELGKGLLKVALLGGIAWWWGSRNLAGLLGLGRGELLVQLASAWDAAVSLVLLLALGLAIIAMIDWPIQFVRRTNRLKMTHQEMRDENKQSEGSPENRAAQRQRQREIARGGVKRAMDEAQFLLTNPSHFAVAMTYDPALAPAPVVLAKGRDEKALAMRELAMERGLPVLEYPALARSIYFTTRDHQVVREELYIAIAALIAFVHSIKRGEHPPRPNVEVPVALRFDAKGKTSVP